MLTNDFLYRYFQFHSFNFKFKRNVPTMHCSLNLRHVFIRLHAVELCQMSLHERSLIPIAVTDSITATYSAKLHTDSFVILDVPESD